MSTLTIDTDTLKSKGADPVSWTNRLLMTLCCNSLNKCWTIYLCDVLCLAPSLLATHSRNDACLEKASKLDRATQS